MAAIGFAPTSAADPDAGPSCSAWFTRTPLDDTPRMPRSTNQSATPATARLGGVRWLSGLLGVGLVLYTGVLIVATHLPSVGGMVRYPGADKVLHVLAYTVLGTLAAAVIHSARGLSLRNVTALLILLALFAAADELTQPWFSRQAEGGDWLADCVGFGLGVSVVALVAARLQQRVNEEKPLP